MTEYMAVEKKMQQEMSGVKGSTPEEVFAAKMIPHHQGAVDMAQVALKHAKDPEIRRIAEKTITDQQKDIAELQEWLKKQKK